MSSGILSFLKNFSYTLSSNLISLIISTLVTLIVPKTIGVESYGYWQLYIFYTSYVGFFHLGWVDGIYLRYGGEEYDNLDKSKFFSQFILLSGLLLFFAILLIIFSSPIEIADRRFIFKMIAINLVVMNLSYFLQYLLQATNRIKDFAHITILDRTLFIVFVSILIITGLISYKVMIVSDLLAKTAGFLYAIWVCKEIIFQKTTSFVSSLNEAVMNISVGIKLLFANLASTLIIGTVKFGIERGWDVETFGKVSLTLSISNFMMIFINGIGIVIYPVLRRTSIESLKKIYSTMRDLLMIISFGTLLLYYPFREILSSWLPAYSESFGYMALLFPVVVYEGKTSLLINTYLKVLRKEKVLMRINIISLSISVILTFFSTVVLHNLYVTVFTILIVQIIRSFLSEFYLYRHLRINILKDVLLEILLTITFVLSGWFLHSWFTVVVYGLAYLCYLFIKKKNILKAFFTIRTNFSKKA